MRKNLSCLTNFCTTICVFPTVIKISLGSWILANIIQREAQESTQTVESALQLLRSQEYYFITNEPDQWFFEKINQSTNFPYEELRNIFRQNPPENVKGVDLMLSRVKYEKAITYMQDDDRTNFYSRPYCHFEAIRLGMPMASKFKALKRSNKTNLYVC